MRARRRHARQGEEERRLWRRHMGRSRGLPRRGEELARTGAGGAPGPCEREDPGLPDGGCGEPQATRRRCCGEVIRPLEGLRRLETPNARSSRPHVPIGLPPPPPREPSKRPLPKRAFSTAPRNGRLKRVAGESQIRESKDCGIQRLAFRLRGQADLIRVFSTAPMKGGIPPVLFTGESFRDGDATHLSGQERCRVTPF